jgi:S1-C subfamily serine protease
MRKFAGYSAAALLAFSAIAGGVSYAQDATAEAPDTTVTVPQLAGRTWLGIAVDADLTITRVAAGSPAETAQLELGDVITAVDGTSVASADDLRSIIEATATAEGAKGLKVINPAAALARAGK